MLARPFVPFGIDVWRDSGLCIVPGCPVLVFGLIYCDDCTVFRWHAQIMGTTFVSVWLQFCIERFAHHCTLLSFGFFLLYFAGIAIAGRRGSPHFFFLPLHHTPLAEGMAYFDDLALYRLDFPANMNWRTTAVQSMCLTNIVSFVGCTAFQARDSQLPFDYGHRDRRIVRMQIDSSELSSVSPI